LDGATFHQQSWCDTLSRLDGKSRLKPRLRAAAVTRRCTQTK
jgi:hypothetical protein